MGFEPVFPTLGGLPFTSGIHLGGKASQVFALMCSTAVPPSLCARRARGDERPCCTIGQIGTPRVVARDGAGNTGAVQWGRRLSRLAAHRDCQVRVIDDVSLDKEAATSVLTCTVGRMRFGSRRGALASGQCRGAKRWRTERPEAPCCPAAHCHRIVSLFCL